VSTLERAFNRSNPSETKYLKLAEDLENRVNEKIKEIDIARKERDQY